ncbi:MAG: nucleotidyltransferase family protein [Pseudomonadota bacterium]
MSDERVYAVVLAAGAASRYGSTKQLAMLGGETLVHRAARLARQLCGERSLLVVGHDAAEVYRAAQDGCQFLAVNERFADGLGSSLSLAARVLTGAADAFVLLLADQPRVTIEHLEALIERWDGAGRSIVATAYNGTLGAPALLPAGLFSEIAALKGDRGARALFDAPDVDVLGLSFEAAAIDVDTPLAALKVEG